MKNKIIVETANREYAQEAVKRIVSKIEVFLEQEAEKYEPETDNYINGELSFVVEIKVAHKPYKLKDQRQKNG